MKKFLFLALAAASINSVQAQETDAAVVFSSTLKDFDGLFYSKQNCDSVLQKSWSGFAGNASEYASLEKKYMDGAMTASICAIRRGYLTYLWLGEVEKVKMSGVVKKSGPEAALNQATDSFMKIPVEKMNGFLTSVSCDASTPNIRFNNTFSQVVMVSCQTSLGPAKVDLQSLYITVGGKDIWNGQRGEYLGRNLAKALESRK